MPSFALWSPDVEYGLTATRVRILRPYVRADVGLATGFRHFTCFLDTGAPISIVSR
jgi:hypothetical protein